MIFLCIFSLILATVHSTAKCSTYTCPTDYFSNSTLSDVTCVADPCTTDDDRDTCCFAKALCSDWNLCPTGQSPITGATCSEDGLHTCTEAMCCATGCDARPCGTGERKFDKISCADNANCMHWECCSACDENGDLTTMHDFNALVSKDVSNCYELIREISSSQCANTLKEIGETKFNLDSALLVNNVTNVDYKLYRVCPNSCKSCEEHHEDYTVELNVTLVIFSMMMLFIVCFFVIAPKPDNSEVDEDKKELNKSSNSRGANPYEPIDRDEYGKLTLDKENSKLLLTIE